MIEYQDQFGNTGEAPEAYVDEVSELVGRLYETVFEKPNLDAGAVVTACSLLLSLVSEHAYQLVAEESREHAKGIPLYLDAAHKAIMARLAQLEADLGPEAPGPKEVTTGVFFMTDVAVQIDGSPQRAHALHVPSVLMAELTKVGGRYGVHPREVIREFFRLGLSVDYAVSGGCEIVLRDDEGTESPLVLFKKKPEAEPHGDNSVDKPSNEAQDEVP